MSGLIPGSLRVTAVSAGTYQGRYYNAADVFDLLQAGDYSDSTLNAQPGGGEWAPGWMLSVVASTPLYQWVSATVYPAFPAVDAPRRFVL